jgi:hypothetical protein
MEEGEEDDHEGPGPITSSRPWQPGTLMSKISRTVRGGEEVARNVRKGCRTLDMMMMMYKSIINDTIYHTRKFLGIIMLIKGKAVPLHAMEALGGRGGIAPTHSRPRH